MLIIYLLLLLNACYGQLNLKPKQFVTKADIDSRSRFFGSRTTANEDSDHFKLLATDGDSLLVGARNTVYNLSLTTLAVHHKILWEPPASDIEDCMMKGKRQSDCQNYIRVLARQSSGRSLICGTHAFAPKCREYAYSKVDGELKVMNQFDGTGLSPYDPRDNSTALFIPHTNELYAGTVSDFIGSDPLIYKKKIDNVRDLGLRTSRSDARVLDAPNFVGSFVFKEHVYFFYREWASEAVDNNEERQIYARVARVCTNDRGGARPANERWTSYTKARLNCSLSSNSPFYFNELKSVSEPIPHDNDHFVYAVFSTADSALKMSAVCAFSMKRIRDEFDHGTFKHQRTPSSVWAPYSYNDIPKPRPGACVPDSTKLPESTVAFVTRNPLLYRAIQSVNGPLLIEGSDHPDLTQVAVLNGVESVNGDDKYEIVFLGTSDGRVLKLLQGTGNTTIIQSMEVFSSGSPVVNLFTTSSQLIVVSSDEIASVELHFCQKQSSCSGCVRLQDPHCAWDRKNARCVNKETWIGGDFIQNVIYGHSEQCPDYDIFNSHPDQDPIIAPSTAATANTQSVILAAFIAAVIAMVIGIVIGHHLGRSRANADHHRSASSTSGSDYDSFGRARLTRHDSLTTAAKIDHVYGCPPKTSVDATSMVLTMPAAMSASTHGSGVNTPNRDKNAILTSLNQSTLPRDYKVKKVYL